MPAEFPELTFFGVKRCMITGKYISSRIPHPNIVSTLVEIIALRDKNHTFFVYFLT